MSRITEEAEFREPVRLEVPLRRWRDLSTADRETYIAAAEREMEEVGLIRCEVT